MISIISAADNTYIPCIGTSAIRDRLAAWYDSGRMTELPPYGERLHRVEDLPISTPDAIEQPPPRLNTLYWPIFGVSRYAYAVFLLASDDVAALQADVIASGSRVTLSYTDSPDASDDPRVFPMYYIAARPVVLNDSEALDLYYVIFADIRYLWQNVTGIAGGPTMTWDEVFTQLVTILPDAPAFTITDAVEAAYLTPSANWSIDTLEGRNTTWLLDGAAAIVGSRIVMTPDTFTLQRPTDANLAIAVDAYDANVTDTRLGGGGTLDDDDWTSSVPNTVKCVFPGSPPVVTLAPTDGLQIGEATAWMDIDASATSAEQLAAATQWASDYYDWQAAPYDVTWIGFIAPPDSGFLSAIEVSHDAGYTKVYRPPLAYSSIYQGSGLLAATCSTTGAITPGTQIIGGEKTFDSVTQTVSVIGVANIGFDGDVTPLYYPFQLFTGGADTIIDVCATEDTQITVCEGRDIVGTLYSTGYPTDESPWIVNNAISPYTGFVSAAYYIQDQCDLDADLSCADTHVTQVWGLGQQNGSGNPPGFQRGTGVWLLSNTDATGDPFVASVLVSDAVSNGGVSGSVISTLWTDTLPRGSVASPFSYIRGGWTGGYGLTGGGFAVSINDDIVGDGTNARYLFPGAWTGVPYSGCSDPPNTSLTPGCGGLGSIYYEAAATQYSNTGLPLALMAVSVAGGIVIDASPVDSYSAGPNGSSGTGTQGTNAFIGGYWLQVTPTGSSDPVWIKVLAYDADNPCVSSPPPPPPPPPPPLAYDCVSGTCVLTTGGTYSTLSACITACGSSPPPPPCACPTSGSLTVLITGGCTSINGSYIVTWNEADLQFEYIGCTTPGATPCIKSMYLSGCSIIGSTYTFDITINILCPLGETTTVSAGTAFACGSTATTVGVAGCCGIPTGMLAEPHAAIASTGAVRIPLDCVYQETYSEKGKTHVKCGHADTPNGKTFCLCTNKCGPSCVGYSGVEPDRREVVNKSKLIRSTDGRVFNAGVCEYNGRRLMAYRAGLANGRIWIAEDGKEPVRLRISHPLASVTQDDPRLVVLGGVLYCTFSAVGHTRVCSVLMAELSDDLSVVRVFEPDYPARSQHEKNWVAFESNGAPYFVYSITPHKMLSLDLVNEYCQEVASTAGVPLKGFDLRGGAPPVLHAGEWYTFYHSHAVHAGKHYYKTYAYTFENRMPFRVTRYTPESIWTPSGSYANTNPARDVIFPCGAVREPDGWMITAGAGDTDIIRGYYHDSTIEGALESIV